MTDKDFSTFDAINPKGIVQVYRDYWWWCVDGDPTKALVYNARGLFAPQCNRDEACARAVGTKLGHDTRAQLVQIPLAFVRWRD